MANSYFQFKQFTVFQNRCAMKITTDACLFGAWCAKEIKDSKTSIKNVIDIGTGTGLLSLLIAQQNNIPTDAVEINKEAAEQAAENIAASPWKNRITIFNEDILSFNTKNRYDCIVSNPPFYENELASPEKNKNIAHHSHQLKLSQLLPNIFTKLTATGILFLLLPFKRDNEVEILLSTLQLYVHKKIIVQPSVLHTPFRIMLMVSKQKSKPMVSKLVITNEKKEYSAEFAALLNPYYLHI